MVKQVEVNGEQVIYGRNGALVASKSEAGSWHVVKLVGYERTCDCLGFRNRFICRHVRAVESFVKANGIRETIVVPDAPPTPTRKPAATYDEFAARYAVA